MENVASLLIASTLLVLTVSSLRKALESGEFEVGFRSILADPFLVARPRHNLVYWLVATVHFLCIVLFAAVLVWTLASWLE